MGNINGGEVDWKISVLPRETKAALDFFAEQEWLKNSSWYLAGGTALALYAGHRKSFDLDFFCQEPNFSADSLISNFSQEDWVTDVAQKDTVYGRLRGVKISFIANHLFIPKEQMRQYGSVKILDLRDIAVMKIIAASQRGRRRDFIDLFWYAENKESLLEVIKRLPKQYPSVAHDYHHILKSLVYFVDAQEDPMPQLLFKADWEQIKEYFEAEVAKIAKELAKLD